MNLAKPSEILSRGSHSNPLIPQHSALRAVLLTIKLYRGRKIPRDIIPMLRHHPIPAALTLHRNHVHFGTGNIFR